MRSSMRWLLSISWRAKFHSHLPLSNPLSHVWAGAERGVKSAHKCVHTMLR